MFIRYQVICMNYETNVMYPTCLLPLLCRRLLGHAIGSFVNVVLTSTSEFLNGVFKQLYSSKFWFFCTRIIISKHWLHIQLTRIQHIDLHLQIPYTRISVLFSQGLFSVFQLVFVGFQFLDHIITYGSCLLYTSRCV